MTTEELLPRVRIKCIEQGITMTELAVELGINYNYMYQCLRGWRRNAEIIGKVKNRLGIED